MYKRWALGSITVVFAVALGLSGCGNSPIAVVNGVRITESEFNERLIRNAGRETLQDMINRQLVKQMAEEAKITVSDEDLNKEVEQIKAQIPPQEFQRVLTARNTTEEEWREALKLEMIRHKLERKDVKYADKDLKEFFERFKDRYAVPTLVSISEIVVGSKEDAEEVLAELKKDKGKFADLARTYSQAPYTRANGGKRPPDMPLERVTPEPVKDAVAEMSVGEISSPIAAVGQWYIIKLDDKKAARKADWEKDKDRVKADYEGQNATPISRLIEEYVRQADVQIVDPRFQDLKEQYTPVPEKQPQFGPQAPQSGGEQPSKETPAEPPAEGDDSQ